MANVAALLSQGSSLTSAATNALALRNLILVTPGATIGYQPLNPNGSDGRPSESKPPKSFVFAYEGEQSVTLESDITDHYVQDNIAVQDQMSLKPPMYNSYGYIGELDDVLPGYAQLLKNTANKLTTVGVYTPKLTITAQRAYQAALFSYQTSRNVVNSISESVSGLGNLISGNSGQSVIGPDGLLKKGTAQNKQQTAFQLWYAYWNNRTLFNVQTPWAVYSNMAIQRLRAIQEADTDVVSGFEVSFKQIRTVASISVAPGSSLGASALEGRLALQSAPGTNLGASSGSESSTSFGSALSTMVG